MKGKSWQEAVWKLLSVLVESAWNAGAKASFNATGHAGHWDFLETHWSAVAGALARYPVFDFSRVEAEIRVAAAGVSEQKAASEVEVAQEIRDSQPFPTIQSIATYLRVVDSTVRRWRKNGTIQIKKRDGNYICSKSQLRMRRDSRRKP